MSCSDSLHSCGVPRQTPALTRETRVEGSDIPAPSEAFGRDQDLRGRRARDVVMSGEAIWRARKDSNL